MEDDLKVLIVIGILITIIVVGLPITIQFAFGIGELQCIDFNKKMYQHIHIILTVDGKSPPGGIGLAQGCFREMHTHWADHWVHLESTEPKNFTLRQFFELWGQSTMGYKSLQINGQDAHWDTVLKDLDRVVISP